VRERREEERNKRLNTAFSVLFKKIEKLKTERKTIHDKCM
jgi:hypothetical protein